MSNLDCECETDVTSNLNQSDSVNNLTWIVSERKVRLTWTVCERDRCNSATRDCVCLTNCVTWIVRIVPSNQDCEHETGQNCDCERDRCTFIVQVKQSNWDCEFETGVTSNQDCEHETGVTV